MKGPRAVTLSVAAAAALFLSTFTIAVQTQTGATEAPAGFDLVSNGFAEQFCANQGALTNSPNSPMIDDDECNFDTALEEFSEPNGIDEGLGPIFNATGCADCHLVPIIGGSSQINEKRAGFFDGFTFFEHPGGSLIQDRALDPRDQELATPANTNVIALRTSLNVLGDGFVEAIGNSTLEAIQDGQPLAQRGTIINVPVSEFPGQARVGRFGHKDQQASLLSFSADAYKNEMGITSPLEPVENTSNGNAVVDPHPGEPNITDDDGQDVELFALFMRSTKVPPRDTQRANSSDGQAGSSLFSSIGCATCHVRNITTVATNTLINGGALRVPSSLGNKIIHPFSDFLLHDVGTGDGIVQNGGQGSRNRVRTPALWGLRARGRLMHDGLSLSLTDAIQRHGNQGATARNNFNNLTNTNKNRLITFLLSL